MGVETWYRGEAVGVDPATHGGVTHDLKDGMYFADTESVAGTYAAERAPRLQDRRVFIVSIDRGSMRILDLTTHPGWQKLMRTKLFNGDTPEAMLMRQPAAQEYEKFFDSFLQTNKIDLNSYDAVIGPEFRNGGKQMVILHKNGKPSQLHVRIRKMFRPLTPSTMRVRSWIPKINIKVRAIRIVGGIKGIGGSAVGQLAITIILTLVERWMEKKMIKDQIEKGLKEIEPKIADELDKMKFDIAKTQLRYDKGEKVIANVHTEIHWIKKSLGGGKPSYMDPEVRLGRIDITNKDLNFERTFEHTEGPFSWSVDEYVQSFEVGVYSDEELELFRDLQDEYLSYKHRLRIDSANPVLIEETRRLRQQISEAFGVDLWFLDI